MSESPQLSPRGGKTLRLDESDLSMRPGDKGSQMHFLQQINSAMSTHRNVGCWHFSKASSEHSVARDDSPFDIMTTIYGMPLRGTTRGALCRAGLEEFDQR